jgi:hypothetical protein
MPSAERPIRCGRTGRAQPRPARRRWLTGLVLVAFVLQFSRFYLAASANQDLCPEQPSARAGVSHPGHSHDEATLPPAPGSEDGPLFQHCKEHVYSLGLTHAQPFSEPEAAAVPRTASLFLVVPPALVPFSQSDLTTPFHPPRHLS